MKEVRNRPHLYRGLHLWRLQDRVVASTDTEAAHRLCDWAHVNKGRDLPPVDINTLRHCTG